MATKPSAEDSLVAVVRALEPLKDDERQWVLQSAAARWRMTPPSPTGNVGPASMPLASAPSTAFLSANAADAETALAQQNIRTFMRVKAPKTDVQRVACLVYYLNRTTGQPAFASKDIVTAQTDSGISKFNMTRALDNATRHAKYLSNRGREKQLTNLGEDVVHALPSQEAVKEAEMAGRGRGKARGRKSKKKAA